MRAPLPLVALCYTAGLLAGFYWPVRPLCLFLSAFLVAFLLLVQRSMRRRRFFLIALIPLVGWTNMVARTAVLSRFDLRRLAGDQPQYVTLLGTLTEAPVCRRFERNRRIASHTTAQIDVVQLSGEHGLTRALGRVTVSTPGELDNGFFTGQWVAVKGVLQPPKGPVAPGQFDYRAYLNYLGIYFQLRADSTNDWRIRPFPGATPLRPPFSDRFNAWAQRTLAKGLPVEDESLRLIWAMVLGWKPALTQEVAEPFMQSGTLHIFAISGLHIALIAGILVSLLRVARISRGLCGWLVIPTIWFYTLATGWQASAIRSTIMMTIIIFGWALERPSHVINSLAAAGLIILIWDPLQLFQAGFQLSFFVVLGLALLVPPIERIRQRLLQRDPLVPDDLRPRWQVWLEGPIRLVTTSLATSLAAWLGSMPLIAYYFYMVTPGSLLANLVIVPLSSVALMSSLGSIVCGDWLPSLTVLFNHASWLWMQLMIWLSQWFAALPGAFFYLPPPSLLGFLLYYLVLGLLLSGRMWQPGWGRWTGVTAAFALILWLLSPLLVAAPLQLTILPNRAGTIFIKPAGNRNDLLIDCGDPANALSMTKPFLASQGVNRISALLLTHGDLHHVAGMDEIVSRFSVGQIVTSTASFRSPAYRKIIAQLEQRPSRWQRIQRGDAVAGWTVLHPGPNDRFPRAVDATIVLHGCFQGTRVLLLSKLGRLGQRTLLQPDLSADILIGGIPDQVDAFSDALLQVVHPRLLIVSSSDFPASLRPSAQLRSRLASLQIPVIYTSEAGAVTIRLYPAGRFEVRTMNGQRFLSTNFVNHQTGSLPDADVDQSLEERQAEPGVDLEAQ